jgi:hypothetical protein
MKRESLRESLWHQIKNRMDYVDMLMNWIHGFAQFDPSDPLRESEHLIIYEINKTLKEIKEYRCHIADQEEADL